MPTEEGEQYEMLYEPEEDDRYKTQYERQKSQAVYWYNKASDLRGSAGAIWASMCEPEFAAVPERLGLGRSFSFTVACGSVYRMLCGMALELLLKAIIIEKGGKPKSLFLLAGSRP